LNDAQLGPYPLEKLKRTDRPTTAGPGETKRRSARENPMWRIGQGAFGEKLKQRRARFFDRDPLCSSFSSLQRHIANFPLPAIAEKKAPLPADPRVCARHIKSLGYFLGADMVGICRLPRSAVFSTDYDGSEIDCDYAYAIVLLNVKKTDVIRQSYGREWIDDPCSFQSYQRCACQAQVMTGYLRRLGWRADSSVFDKYTTLMPQLVIEAGLGEGSRIGIALNPFVGASFKVSAVLTDLPMEVDRPIDFGLQDYCARCGICAEQCPMQALSHGEREVYNGYMKWPVEGFKCAIGVVSNEVGNICQRCTKVCPWNRRDNSPADFAEWDGDLAFLHASADRQAEYLRRNDYIEPEEFSEKWWFPFVLADGEIGLGKEFDYDAHRRRTARARAGKTESGVRP
jgi:ferredoxin